MQHYKGLLAGLILVGGFSLAKGIYDSGTYCTPSGDCFSDTRVPAKVVGMVSMGLAASILNS